MSPTNQNSSASKPDWIAPPGEEEGLSRYLQTIRERLWVVVLAVVVTTAVALIYVATTPKSYQAEAGILVTPVPPEDSLLVRVGLISGSADPARDIQTIARLVTTNEVATRAQRELEDVPEAQGLPEDLLNHVTAEPVAESNIVAVTASAGTPEDAAEIANVVTGSLIDERTDELHRKVEGQLELLQPRLEADPASEGLAQQVAQLEGLLTTEDPTLQLATEAEPPTVPTAPRPLRSILAGLLAGLVLGIGAAFAYQALDPRLRREDQLRRLYALPILARVPREGRSADRPLSPRALSPAASEAYRALRGTLAISERPHDDFGRSILITGSSPSDGKTTTAVNLAASLAAAGKRVILIEADLRRPSIGRALGTGADAGVVAVMLEEVPIEDALVTSTPYGENLGLLLADYEGDTIGEVFVLPSATRMLEDARRLADYVIVDSPPLIDVVDALPLARQADQVLLVARLGNTRMAKLTQLGELLGENGVRPVGIVLVGTPRPRRSEYQYYQQGERRLVRADSSLRRLTRTTSRNDDDEGD